MQPTTANVGAPEEMNHLDLKLWHSLKERGFSVIYENFDELEKMVRCENISTLHDDCTKCEGNLKLILLLYEKYQNCMSHNVLKLQETRWYNELVY